MRRRSVIPVLAVTILLAAAVACGRTEEDAAEAARKDETVSPGSIIDYEGPQTPKDSEWLLRSLNGDEAAEGSDITLFHDKQELNVEGGCMGFYIVHELEDDRIRVVEPGLQVGRLECGKPEEVQRQAEDILDIMRNLARVRATEEVFELRSESGGAAAFVPPAPAQVDPALAGTDWIVTLLNGRKPLPGPPSTLEIGEEELVGFGACNGFGGAIDRMAGGEIVWSSQANEAFSSTTVGCGGPAGRQEMEFEEALAGAESYRLDGDRMELRNAQRRTTVVLRQKTRSTFDPAVLENTRWKVRTVDGEEPLEGSVPTIQFGSENQVTWYDGCQEHGARTRRRNTVSWCTEGDQWRMSA